MKEIPYLAFWMVILLVVGSFIGQGYGMMMARHTPGRAYKINPVVQKTLELYEVVADWFS